MGPLRGPGEERKKHAKNWQRLMFCLSALNAICRKIIEAIEAKNNQLGYRCSDAVCRKIVEETVNKWGHLDILVNNASYQGKSAEKFEDIDRERLEFTFHSNILKYFTTSQAAVKHLKEGSAIININSIQGYNPSPGVLDYSTTKVRSWLIQCPM